MVGPGQTYPAGHPRHILKPVPDSLNVDLSAAYVVLQGRVNTATKDNGGVGIYGSHAGEFSLSGTYHM
jgi:hypothetical protein